MINDAGRRKAVHEIVLSLKERGMATENNRGDVWVHPGGGSFEDAETLYAPKQRRRVEKS